MMNSENPMQALEGEMPEVMAAFRAFHDAVGADGELSAKTKKLIMIGISVAIRCEPCIKAHVSQAKEMGIRREEMMEAAAVAMLLGGGPAAAYAGKYLLDELDAV